MRIFYGENIFDLVSNDSGFIVFIKLATNLC